MGIAASRQEQRTCFQFPSQPEKSQISRFMAQDNYWAVCKTRKRSLSTFSAGTKRNTRVVQPAGGEATLQEHRSVIQTVCVCVCACVTPDEVSVHINTASLRELQRLLVPELMKAR